MSDPGGADDCGPGVRPDPDDALDDGEPGDVGPERERLNSRQQFGHRHSSTSDPSARL
jgi:hypothetical protein